MPDTCLTLPAYPDAGEPCVNGTDLVLIARCVGGQRVLMWVFITEIGDAAPLPMAAPKSSAPCAKVKLLETAERCQWSADQVVTVAKSLGLK